MRTLALALTAMLALQPACAEELVDIPEELLGEPHCALIIGTYGHYDDGQRWMIVNYETGLVAAGCICATPADVEAGLRDQALNDAALAQCRRQAATQDFAWDECQDDYAAQEWLDVVIRPGRADPIKPAGLACVN